MRALFMADRLITLMETDHYPVPGEAIDGLVEILAETPWPSSLERGTAQALLERLLLVNRTEAGRARRLQGDSGQ